jgi:hypothetical protein
MNPLPIILIVITIASAQVLAETASIVGTWQRNDKSLVEFKEDGAVILSATGKPIAKWQGWPQPGTPHLHLVQFAGQIGRYKTWTHHYQRKLTIEHPGNGTKTNLERVDKGPTENPDVPDLRSALQMESRDIRNQITDLQLRLPKVQAEAAAKWQMHWSAKAIGRISTHNIKAQELDATAASIIRSIATLEDRLRDVQDQLSR